MIETVIVAVLSWMPEQLKIYHSVVPVFYWMVNSMNQNLIFP